MYRLIKIVIAAVIAFCLLAGVADAQEPWADEPTVKVTGARLAPEVDLTAAFAWWAERGITTAPALERHEFPGCPDGIAVWKAESMSLLNPVTGLFEEASGLGTWCVMALDPNDSYEYPLPPPEWCHLVLHELGHALGLRHADAAAFPIMGDGPSWEIPEYCDPTMAQLKPDAAPKQTRKRARKHRRHRHRGHVAFREGRLR